MQEIPLYTRTQKFGKYSNGKTVNANINQRRLAVMIIGDKVDIKALSEIKWGIEITDESLRQEDIKFKNCVYQISSKFGIKEK